MTVPIGLEEITIASPYPASVTIKVDRGSTGERGNKLWSGKGHPAVLSTTGPPPTIFGETIINNDYYLNVINGKTYKYLSAPAGSGWTEISGTPEVTTLSGNVIDFLGSYYQVKTITTATEFTTTSLGAGRSVNLLLSNEDLVLDYNLTWPVAWKWSGTAPAKIEASKNLWIRLVCTDANGTVYAAL